MNTSVSREHIIGLLNNELPKRFAIETTFSPDDYSASPSGSVFLTGGTGCGKTHRACRVLASNVIRAYEGRGEKETHRISFRYRSVPELLLRLKGSFHKKDADEPTEDEIVDYFASQDFLLLDDFGANGMSEWALTNLYVIINRRYESLRPTIITSNLSLAQIAESMGDRIASRIAEMCEVVKMDGPDRRLRK